MTAPEPDEARGPLDPEAVARWAALAGALVALAGLAVVVGASVAPWLAWALVLAVSGGCAAVLWRRHFERVSLDRERERARPAAEPLSLPQAWTPDR